MTHDEFKAKFNYRWANPRRCTTCVHSEYVRPSEKHYGGMVCSHRFIDEGLNWVSHYGDCEAYAEREDLHYDSFDSEGQDRGSAG